MCVCVHVCVVCVFADQALDLLLGDKDGAPLQARNEGGWGLPV